MALEREKWRERWCQSNLVISTNCQVWVMLYDNHISHINIMEVRRERGLYDNFVDNGGKETKARVLFATAFMQATCCTQTGSKHLTHYTLSFGETQLDNQQGLHRK